MHRQVVLLPLVAVGLLSGACDESPSGPSDQAVVTFSVVGETFRARLTTREQVAAAEAARDGGRASIPVGLLRAGDGGVNTGWSWHLVDITFAEAAIEVCDGLPSHVEREGPSFANGQYCPWSARVIDIK